MHHKKHKERQQKMTQEKTEQTATQPAEQPTAKAAHPSPTEEIARLQAEVDKWKEATLRAHADMENLKRRTAIDLEKNTKYATSSFAKDFLTVSDCLENALCHIHKAGEKSDEFLQGMIQGIEMTYKQFQCALNKHGIERIKSMDKPFDPDKHKVVQEVPSDKPAGVIVQELQPGYTIGGDRILREATVIVSKGE